MSLFGSAKTSRQQSRLSARKGQRYEQEKVRAAERSRKNSEQGRDIGELPAVSDLKRREACRFNFRLYLETYHADQFYLEWGPDHLEIIAAVEAAVLKGDLLAFAMARGSGKTAIIRAAALWAILYGHRKYVVIVAASADHGIRMLSNIKTKCETTKLLLADFPEAIYPVKRLGRITNRARGQHYNGEPTHIQWTEDEIHFASIQGAASSGGVICVRGIDGSIRGLSITRPGDGCDMRPDLVLVDDPQTDKTAISPATVAKYERVFKGAVLGLAGPDVKIAGLVAVTVIAPDDLAERLLDRKRNPACHGRRMKMVYEWPTATEMWEHYKELRQAGQQSGEGTDKADAYFAENLDAMTAGCRVGWPSRMRPGEIHPIQTAWNIRIDDGESAFAAEYQNEPLPQSGVSVATLSSSDIADKINRYERNHIPLSCQYLTSHWDVQGEALYWLVAAWEENFTGYVIDYGTYPEQPKSYFTVRTLSKRLSNVSKAKSAEGALLEGLEVLSDRILSMDYTREDGAQMRIERCLVDAGFRTDTVYQFCRESRFRGVLMPSHGQSVRARDLPFALYSKKPGDLFGHHWRVPNVAKKRVIRHVMMDTNYWKTFVHSRLATPRGDAGCLSLFGSNPDAHRMFADHMVAELRTTRTEKGRTVEEWESPPSKPDNHHLDNIVGAAVAASMLGATLSGAEGFRAGRKKRVSFADMQRQRRGGR